MKSEATYNAVATQPHIRTQKKGGPVAVVGLGYVGLPLALSADKRGYDVIGYDVDRALIAALSKRTAPLFLNAKDTSLAHAHHMTLSHAPDVLKDAKTFIVCVPTPVSKKHVPNLKALVRACTAIAIYLRPGVLVVIESTINPGVCDEIIIPLLEKRSGLTVDRDFFFAHCPERINPGDATWTVQTIPRVLGATGPESLRRAKALYNGILRVPLHTLSSVREAEAVKMVENSFRDINIAFVNELAMSFEKLGIDILHVLQGAATKPFGFMPHVPGCGVGGHCIPVDPYYLIAYAEKNGFNHRFLKIARSINNHMPHYTVDLLENTLAAQRKNLRGKKIAVLGVAYKPNVPDVRESPSIEIIKEIERRGAHAISFDPLVTDQSSAPTLRDALTRASAVILATGHRQFASITPHLLRAHGITTLIDGRNFFEKEPFVAAGIQYQGIGR